MINIKMKYFDLDVSLECGTEESYSINNRQFLKKFEELLDHLSMYRDVDLKIVSKSSEDCLQEPPSMIMKIDPKLGTLTLNQRTMNDET